MSLFIPKDVKKIDFGKYLQSFFKKIKEQNIENLIIDLSYNTGGDSRLGKQLIWYLTDKEPKGFREYIHNSDYYRKAFKNDYKKYNNLYKTTYGKNLPDGETQITNELVNETFFDEITNEKSLFFVDNSIPKFKGKVYLIISPETFSAGQVLATTLADNGIATVIGRPLGNKPSAQTGGLAFKLPNTKKIVSMSYFFMERPNQTRNNEDSLYPEIEIHNSFEDFMKGDNKIFEYIFNEIKK
jgi:C-terminal processing protease CtpA/Prc